jgi:hypothetical protein
MDAVLTTRIDGPHAERVAPTEQVIPDPFGVIRDVTDLASGKSTEWISKLAHRSLVVVCVTIIAVFLLMREVTGLSLTGAIVLAVLTVGYSVFTMYKSDRNAASREERGDEPAQSGNGDRGETTD